MNKNILFAAATIITAMSVFTACAAAQNESGDLYSSMADESKVVMNLADISNTSNSIDYTPNAAQNIQNFSYRLFEENMDSANPVLSPMSAYLALAMAGVGADGNTRLEFYQVLGDDMTAVSDDMMNMLPTKPENQTMTLMMANAAWIDDQFIVDEEWVDSVKSLLDAEVYQADLSSEDAMNDMNSWIKENTNNMIEKMLDEPLNRDARLALFNTVYFKAKWVNPFEAMNTYSDEFRMEDGSSIKTDMMHQYSAYFDYISNDFAEGLIFPYQTGEDDTNIAFIALKPANDADVRELAGMLTGEVVAEMIDEKQTLMVNTKLPKFEISFELCLNDSLKNMGLHECFDENAADFDLMGHDISGSNIYISLVKQKAKIIVDEEGTEAAAVTEVLMSKRCALIDEDPVDVYFDEPFVYLIMDMDQKLPLFIGILDDPMAES